MDAVSNAMQNTNCVNIRGNKWQNVPDHVEYLQNWSRWPQIADDIFNNILLK